MATLEEDNPFFKIGSEMLKTNQYREMIKFVCHCEYAPYRDLVDKIGTLYQVGLIDVACSENKDCAMYAVDKMLQYGALELLDMAKQYVYHPEVLRKINSASNQLYFALGEEKGISESSVTRLLVTIE